VAALALAGLPSQAGSIVGKITDPEGGVLPGVTVIAKSEGRTQTAVTNEKGEYRLDHLLPGAYRVEASLNGFETVVTGNVLVEADKSATWSPELKIAMRGVADPIGDFLGRITKVVGAGAVVCGQHRLVKVATPIPIAEIQKSLACGLEAAAQGKAFWMSYQLQGVEGMIYHGVAGAANGTIYRFFYDSDTGAGEAGFSTEPCARPTIVERDGYVQVRCP
jgi:hypothetical protein